MSARKKSRTMYMHTIDGRAAFFDGEQVSFATEHPHWQDTPAPVVLRPTIDQIQADQAKARRYRERHGWADFNYGYAVVEVPE